jgi:hypothetical protein
VSIWGYTAFQTGGLINKRYQNQDAAGRGKSKPVYRKGRCPKVKLICFRKPNWVGVAKVSKLESQSWDVCSFLMMKLPDAGRHGTLGFWAY